MLEGVSIFNLLIISTCSLAIVGLLSALFMISRPDRQEIGEAVEEIYAQVEEKGGSNVDIAFEGDIYLSQGRKWRFLVNYDDAHGLRQTYYVSLYVDHQAKPISELKWFIMA